MVRVGGYGLCHGGALGCNGRWAHNPFSKVEGCKPKTTQERHEKHFIVFNMKILISLASTMNNL